MKFNEKNGWIYRGLIWGLFMFIFMTLLYPSLSEEPITMKSLLINIPIWIIGGLGFGYTLKLLNQSGNNNRKQVEENIGE